MALITKAVKGMQDITPAESVKWRHIETTCLETARLFGYSELRTPIVEHTELFERGVGDTTDVVQKEMYSFEDRGGRSLTLRPEITASAVRASVENGLIYDALPVKACYIGACCRAEKPQAGRWREFHQFGVECYGASSPIADAEVISLGMKVLDELGIADIISLEINSIGCPECRTAYNEKLREYYSQHLDEICDTCKQRLEKNPMRLLDCKSPVCHEIAEKAPKMLDHLCDECSAHFETVKSCLDNMGISYKVNPSVVRGLDYYTRTVFEFISTDIGAQAAVGGGGRYDRLFKLMGGPDTPAIGFAMGLERLKMVMDARRCEYPDKEKPILYLAPIGQAAAVRCLELCGKIRAEGFFAETDICGRSVKAQMKYADKIGARFTCVIGDDELAAGKVKIRDMENGETQEIGLGEEILDRLYEVSINATLAKIDTTLDNYESVADLLKRTDDEQ